jgi:hypothetical protein
MTSDGMVRWLVKRRIQRLREIELALALSDLVERWSRRCRSI